VATVQTVVDQIQSYLRSAYVLGNGGDGTLRAAPDNPTDNMSIFPFAVCYPLGGEWHWGNGQGDKKGLHDIVIEIHWARRDLTRENEMMAPWIERIPNLLMLKLINDNHWNNTISTFGGDSGPAFTYRTGSLGTYSDIEHFGIVFTVRRVKIHSNIA
jgi:hypothetical protein